MLPTKTTTITTRQEVVRAASIKKQTKSEQHDNDKGRSDEGGPTMTSGIGEDGTSGETRRDGRKRRAWVRWKW